MTEWVRQLLDTSLNHANIMSDQKDKTSPKAQLLREIREARFKRKLDKEQRQFYEKEKELERRRKDKKRDNWKGAFFLINTRSSKYRQKNTVDSMYR